MNATQFLVEGRHRLSGTIRPSGNKNAALPIICAALLTEHPVTLENVPRIRDVETLVELIATLGVHVQWCGRNTLEIQAKTVESTSLDPKLCRRRAEGWRGENKVKTGRMVEPKKWSRS